MPKMDQMTSKTVEKPASPNVRLGGMQLVFDAIGLMVHAEYTPPQLICLAERL